eukprot:2069455-Pyramimonas_sp.AAC.2
MKAIEKARKKAKHRNYDQMFEHSQREGGSIGWAHNNPVAAKLRNPKRPGRGSHRRTTRVLTGCRWVQGALYK